ncbi:MAG: hypothetical protein N3A53_01670 [Verrucomicrobiae bacterium]|nr:hypothetical protein [Verrucomicrobiae bacterium]
MEQPTPIGLAIVICDQIIEDKLTHKKSLIGIFNQIATPTFPCRHPRMAVFVSLTEGRGPYEVRLRIVHEETNTSIGEVKGQIQFADVNAVAELNFELLNVAFPHPGLYSIEFYCNDALVLERRFHVVKIQPPPSGN